MKLARSFIGTFPCFLCKKRVRVYDYLPDCVLCASCKREVERQEACQEEREAL
jgi:hypothetical protein